jgi:tetratricopeptide (TPR) repeat protein
MTIAAATRRPRLLALVAGLLVASVSAAHADDPRPPAANNSAKIQIARQKVDSGDFAGAIQWLASAVRDKPDDAGALTLIGYSLRNTGKLSEALQYYYRALAVQPKHLGANEYLGELYLELGQLDKAHERLALLEEACGESCEQTRDLEEAIANAERKR